MAPDRLRRDGDGQMMMLAAVLLVIGFIALAGMVARVNQLGTQTAVESEQAILGEVGPLRDALDAGIGRLEGRTIPGASVAVGKTWAVTASTDPFLPSDVGMYVSALNGVLPANTRITAYNSATNVTISGSPTGATAGVGVTVYALSPATTPTLQDGVVALLEQMQRIQSSHGLWMEWEVTCANALDPTTGMAYASLSDGVVWVEVASEQRFTRATCASVTG